jgi:hypothetical protein
LRPGYVGRRQCPELVLIFIKGGFPGGEPHSGKRRRRPRKAAGKERRSSCCWSSAISERFQVILSASPNHHACPWPPKRHSVPSGTSPSARSATSSWTPGRSPSSSGTCADETVRFSVSGPIPGCDRTIGRIPSSGRCTRRNPPKERTLCKATAAFVTTALGSAALAQGKGSRGCTFLNAARAIRAICSDGRRGKTLTVRRISLTTAINKACPRLFPQFADDLPPQCLKQIAQCLYETRELRRTATIQTFAFTCLQAGLMPSR